MSKKKTSTYTQKYSKIKIVGAGKEKLPMERKQPELNLEQSNNIESLLQEFIKQLAERLKVMEEVLVIDRIEENIAVCENRKNGKMKNLYLEELPKNIKEGSILKWKNGKYEIDNSNQIEDRIQNKMNDIWK